MKSRSAGFQFTYMASMCSIAQLLIIQETDIQINNITFAVIVKQMSSIFNKK